MVEKRIVVVETHEQFAEMMQAISAQRCVSLDTETVGLEAKELWAEAALFAQTIEILAISEHRVVEILKQKGLSTDKKASLRELRDRHRTEIRDNNAKFRTIKAKADKNPGGLDHYRNELACVQIGTDHAANGGIGTAYLIRPNVIDIPVLRAFLLSREEVLLHNAKFDYKQLKHHLDIVLSSSNIVDTQAREYVLTMGTGAKIGLDSVLLKYVGFSKDKSVRLENWSGVWTEEMIQYAAGDVLHLFDIAREQDKALKPSLMSTVYLEQDLAVALGDMELEGIGIDKQLASVAAEGARKELQSFEKAVKDLLPGLDNPNSNQQLMEHLNSLGHTLKSVDKKAINSLGNVPYGEAILQMRAFGKVLGTYYEPLRDDCVLVNEGTDDEHFRIFANFNAVGRGDDEAGTDTGRLSSSNPNLQNQPADKLITLASGATVPLRSIFIPAPGNVFVHIDLPAIEPRILAHITQDPTLLRAFREGRDPYIQMGEMMTGRPYDELWAEYQGGDKSLRARMKIALLSVMYGKTAFSLAKENNWTLGEARKFLGSFFAKFPAIKRWVKSTIKKARAQGYLDNLAGGRRYLPGINDEQKWLREHYERAACNFDIQGLAARGMKESLVMINSYIKTAGLEGKVRLLLSVHDEVVVECVNDPVIIEQAIKIVKAAMELGTGQFIPTVPLELEPKVIANWSEGKD